MLCTCNAKCADECVCGGWDDVDSTEAYQYEDLEEDMLDSYQVEEESLGDS
jgi:hypothetical protein